MGADIHLYVERLSDDMEWELVPADTKYGEWYGDRNYNLFAMLADVRNGFGFAGVDTGNRVTPIAAPRGIPENASAEYKRIAGPYVECPDGDADCMHDDIHGGWGEDAHSHSWFTARELHDVDWDQIRTSRGTVTPSQYAIFKRDGRPSGWCGSVTGPGIQQVSNEQMDTLIATGVVKVDPDPSMWENARHYTQVEWTTTWREAAGPNWFAFGESLNKLTRDDGRDVRIVFFFDN